ncbi:TPM domain-containing protein [Xanthobacter oligotrophicus]|uniref:TPM domain-containing protein n=1 Tax=Xanthobacter oligotrophicus TaxID=2607286 RepID=UPI0011F28F51|nr:YgcG family protein [Xanthobacter oligotrophicus]MCG5236198.1 YgcG family protein [Xanthobacter oligotrophicus]
MLRLSKSVQVLVPVLFALVLLAGAPARAELTFPPLTGRVVDAAHVLDAGTLATLDAKLAAQEAKATDQVVVATVPSLQGTSVEDYANRLFRFWQIGQAKKNNGVLLLVAPTDRKVRIEVGYGLEGILTDAVSSTIIRNAIVPAFKAGDMAGGIVKGTDAILEILNLDPDEARARAKRLEQSGWTEEEVDNLIFLIAMIAFWGFIIWRVTRGRGGPGGGATASRRSGRSAGGAWAGGSASTWDWGSGSGGGSGGGGGWSGGGGSSGGGGASGDW